MYEMFFCIFLKYSTKICNFFGKLFIIVENILFMNELHYWCNENGILLKDNEEVFFVDEKLLMRPNYIMNNKIYVNLVDENELTSKYLEFCRLFSVSFGTLIVIPRTILPEITSLAKGDLESKFNIKL